MIGWLTRHHCDPSVAPGVRRGRAKHPNAPSCPNCVASLLGMTAKASLVLPYLVGLALADDVPNLKDADMIAAGRQLFQEKQCAYCHGSSGNGGIKLAGRSDLNPNYVFET